MNEVAAKIQLKDELNPCHISVTMVNYVCDCGMERELNTYY